MVDDHITKNHVILKCFFFGLFVLVCLIASSRIDGYALLGHQLETHLFGLCDWLIGLSGILAINHSDATQVLGVCIGAEVRCLLTRHFTLVAGRVELILFLLEVRGMLLPVEGRLDARARALATRGCVSSPRRVTTSSSRRRPSIILPLSRRHRLKQIKLILEVRFLLIPQINSDSRGLRRPGRRLGSFGAHGRIQFCLPSGGVASLLDFIPLTLEVL